MAIVPSIDTAKFAFIFLLASKLNLPVNHGKPPQLVVNDEVSLSALRKFARGKNFVLR